MHRSLTVASKLATATLSESLLVAPDVITFLPRSLHLNVKSEAREDEDNRVFKKRQTTCLTRQRCLKQEDHETHLVASPDAGIDNEPKGEPNGE